MSENWGPLNIPECKKILQSLKDNFTIIRFRDLSQYKDRTDIKICLLRHDLDLSIDYAVELGKLEHEMSIHSTFFVFHCQPYYKASNFIAKCKILQDMGHEVGLHYDIIDTCLADSSLTAKMVLDRELKFLRDNGLEIYGLAGHGGDFLKYRTENNRPQVIGYQVFKEFLLPNAPMKFKNIDLYTISLKEYGLYEAYHLLTEYPMFYMSDCSSIGLVEQIDVAKTRPHKFFQALMHPCHYTPKYMRDPDYKEKNK